MHKKLMNWRSSQLRYSLFILSFLFISTLSAQIRIIDLRDELLRGPAFSACHSTLRPILVDTLNYFPDIELKRKHSKLHDAVIFRHLLFYSDPSGVNFSIDPLMNLQYGKTMGPGGLSDSIYSTNSRGFKLEGNIGDKFTFVTMFYENQSFYVPYVADHVRETSASVGLGRTKAFKKTGFDYAMATGMIVYRPVKNGEIWFGQGKNFIGSGYRSLLLSDNAMNYIHLRLSQGFFGNRLRWQTIYAGLSTGNRYPASYTEAAFIPKGATFNYLTYSRSKRFEIGLFEGTIWRKYQNGKQLSMDPMQFNPVIGLNAITQGLQGTNNVIIGLNTVVRPWRGVSVYAQLMKDGAGKQGMQIGISKANLFVKNLFVRGEFNTVSRGSYATNDSLENYTQFKQPLAHPMGAGFSEFVGTVGYRYNRISLNIQSSFATFPGGYNGVGTYGRNLLYTDVDERLETLDYQATSTRYVYVNPTLGFIVNPSRNLQITVGALYRNLTSGSQTDKTSYIFAGLSTNLNNLYFDF